MAAQTATQKAEKTRKRKRKARTEVSSSSSSSSSTSSDSEQRSDPLRKSQEPAAQKHNSVSDTSSPEGLNEDDEPIFTQKQPRVNPEQAFEDFYLKQATKEFANDLDKLRSAPDFNGRSLLILIGALKQGTACFSEVERKRVGSAVSS